MIKDISKMDCSTVGSNTRRYDDIINLPHHTSPTRPRMSQHDRAAQFSPFAALTGHNAAIKETARLTEEKVDIDEYKKQELNEKLLMLLESNRAHSVSITHFAADGKKEGGAYITSVGNVRRIVPHEQIVLMEDGTVISMENIVELEIM